MSRGPTSCRVGFLVNPIAGMGGAVGLKGTDGRLYVEALKRGAKPVAPARALRFLSRLSEVCSCRIELLVAGSVMGCRYASEACLESYVCLDVPGSSETTREDTVRVVREFLRLGVDAIVFVGGDGTARDVLEASEGLVPVLGVPSGVKVYSSVFAVSPEAAADILSDYCRGEGALDVGEVVDVNEEALQNDALEIKPYGRVSTLSSGNLRVGTKEFGAAEDVEGLVEYFVSEVYRPGVLYILGPGSTTRAIATGLGVSKTLLGFDAVLDGRLVGKDLSAEDIKRLIATFKEVCVVLSIVGGQGYLIGRGNQQLTPEILKMIGKDRIMVVSSRGKLRRLRHVLVDTGDPDVDREFSGYYRVVTGFGEEYVVKALPASDPEALRSHQSPSGTPR